jgi:uncharacterized protein YbjT (DUF2867 family)
MSKTIFVSGATGTTGGATVRGLLAKGAKVVAGVHSPEKAGALEALGASVRPFDLADVSAMAEAMRGADGLYLVTPVSEQTEALTKAMVEAAKAAGVAHVVKLSGLDVDKADFAFARWHVAAEEAIRASGLGWTFLRANSFIQNFYGAIGPIKEQGVYYNTYAAAPVSLVDARDIGDVAATVLLSDGHVGKIYNMTGPRGVVNDEVVRLLGEAAGKPITSVDVGGEQLAQAFAGFGMPPVVATATAELLGHMATGAAGYVSPDVEVLLGRRPRDVVQWVSENAQAFR